MLDTKLKKHFRLSTRVSKEFRNYWRSVRCDSNSPYHIDTNTTIELYQLKMGVMYEFLVCDHLDYPPRVVTHEGQPFS